MNYFKLRADMSAFERFFTGAFVDLEYCLVRIRIIVEYIKVDQCKLTVKENKRSLAVNIKVVWQVPQPFTANEPVLAPKNISVS